MKTTLSIFSIIIFSLVSFAQSLDDENSLRSPQIDIPSCLFVNHTFIFTDLVNTDPSLTYEWTIGNETIIDDNELVYVFNDYGYYCISLTVGNEQCGYLTHTPEPIFVNPNFCSCDHDDYTGSMYNYDYTDGCTIESGVDEIWETSTPNTEETFYAEGDITIEPNATLTIGENVRIEFAPNGRIIVMAGAKLIIKSYVTLTSLPCENNMWQGIEVWGEINSPHSFEEEGIVEILDETNVLIENAHIAILSGARDMDHLCNPQTNPNLFDDSKGCGLVQIGGKATQFTNNGIGIKLLPSPNYLIGAIWSGNVINTCHFKTSEGENLYDNKYSSYVNNCYPNPQNPWAGHANPYQRTDVGIYMHGIKGLNIEECTFDNMQYGILSYDAKYNVYKSDFHTAIYGIKIHNTLSTIDNRHEIYECSFDMIPGIPVVNFEDRGAAIYINGGRYDYIHDNIFGGSVSTQALNYYGIFTINASSFNISENKFYRYTYANVINNTGDNGGYIGAWLSNEPVDWKGNIFNDCQIAIKTMGDNSHLRLKCNICDVDQITNEYYTVNFLNSGNLANQGSPPSTNPNVNQRLPAGNDFHPPLMPFKKRIESNTPYIYYRHESPLKVIPEVSTSAALINVSPNNLQKDDNPIACPPIFSTPPIIPLLPGLDAPIFIILDSLNYIIDDLKYDLLLISSNIDNGKTYELLDNIHNNMPAGELKNILIDNSPLSDTVISSLLSEYPLPHGSFKEVMQINLPVARELESLLYSVFALLPVGISNQLMPLQAYNPYSNTPAKLQQQIDTYSNGRQEHLNYLIMTLNDSVNNRKIDAITLLENESSIEAKRTLIATYIADGNYDLAADKLASLPIENESVADWVSLNQMLLSLYQEEKNLYSLDSSQLTFVRDLAYKCPADLASSNAQAIIVLLFDEIVPECPAEVNNRNTDITNNNLREIVSKQDNNSSLGDNYPDPASNFTNIPCYLAEKKNGKIDIYDIFGKHISSNDVYSGENILYIDTKSWLPGVYTYRLVVDGEFIETKKIVIYK